MKKYMFLSCALCVSLVAFGQVEVKSDGKVEITPSGSQGIYVDVASSGSSSAYGIISNSSGSPGVLVATPYAAGVRAMGMLTGSSSKKAVAFGVVGQGTGSAYGRNIGVFGYFDSDKTIFPPPPPVYGAGIFGAITYNQCYRNFTEAYAGFFAGDVEVEGTVTSFLATLSSDARYKQNVADLRQIEINKLLRLNPVEYNFKQRYTEYTDSAGNLVQLGVFDENSQLFQNKHYGFIAQEVRELYPNLVYENGDGYLSVDYIGIIPLLVSAVKEQNITINEMKAEIAQLKNAPISQQNAPARPQETTGETVAALFQNTPNPFNENTEIAFYLPQSVTNAMLCVYDMNGRQLSQNVITQRGSSVFVVNGSQYGAGMYLYSLIADNQIVDTKRMILTK